MDIGNNNPTLSNLEKTVNIPTTVLGDWPKPSYLAVPDCYRANRDGRIYIPAEFNKFLDKLKGQSVEEYEEKESTESTAIVKQRPDKQNCFELQAEYYKVCILPAVHADKFCENIRFRPGFKTLSKSLVKLRSPAKQSSGSRLNVFDRSSSQNASIQRPPSATSLKPTESRTPRGSFSPGNSPGSSPRAGAKSSRHYHSIPPFLLHANGKSQPLYHDHHTGMTDIPISRIPLHSSSTSLSSPRSHSRSFSRHDFGSHSGHHIHHQTHSGYTLRVQSASNHRKSSASLKDRFLRTHSPTSSATQNLVQATKSVIATKRAEQDHKEPSSLPASVIQLIPSKLKRVHRSESLPPLNASSNEHSLRAFQHPSYFKRCYNSALYNCINEQINCGVSIATDGFLLRENPFYHFCRHIKGIDFSNLSYRVSHAGAHQLYVPCVVSKLEVENPGFLLDEWMKAQTLSPVPVKACIPGPYTIVQMLSVSGKAYPADSHSTILSDVIGIIAREVHILYGRGCRHIQVDEPALAQMANSASASELIAMVKKVGLCFERVPWRSASSAEGTINDGPPGMRIYLHICPRQALHARTQELREFALSSLILDAADKAGFYGVCIEDSPELDMRQLLLLKKCRILLAYSNSHSRDQDSIGYLRRRVLEALLYVPAYRLVTSPTCGLAYLTEGSASRKLLNITVASRQVKVPSYNYYDKPSKNLPSTRHASFAKVSQVKRSQSIKQPDKFSLAGNVKQKPKTIHVVKKNGSSTDAKKPVRPPPSVSTAVLLPSKSQQGVTSAGTEASSFSVDPVDSLTGGEGTAVSQTTDNAGTSDSYSLQGDRQTSTARHFYKRPQEDVDPEEMSSKFWLNSGISIERGALQQMLISLTEKLLSATRRTAFSYRQKYSSSSLSKGLRKWSKCVGSGMRKMIARANYDLSIGPAGPCKLYNVINKSTEHIGVPACTRTKARSDGEPQAVPFKCSQFYARCVGALQNKQPNTFNNKLRKSKTSSRKVHLNTYKNADRDSASTPPIKAWNLLKQGQKINELAAMLTVYTSPEHGNDASDGRSQFQGSLRLMGSRGSFKFPQSVKGATSIAQPISGISIGPEFTQPDGRGGRSNLDVRVRRVGVSARQVGEAMLSQTKYNTFVKEMAKRSPRWQEELEDRVADLAQTDSEETIARHQRHKRLLKIISVAMRLKPARSEPSRADKKSKRLKATLSASQRTKSRQGTSSERFRGTSSTRQQSSRKIAAQSSKPSGALAGNRSGRSTTSFPAIVVNAPSHVKPSHRLSSKNKLDVRHRPSSSLRGSKASLSRLSSHSKTQLSINDRYIQYKFTDGLYAKKWGRSSFKDDRRGAFSANLTLIKLRGNEISVSDVYKPTRSMEELMAGSGKKRLRPAGRLNTSTPSEEPPLPPPPPPSAFKTVYNLMNQDQTEAAPEPAPPEENLQQKKLNRFRSRLLSEAAKEKKIVEFQSYAKDKKGRAYTQKVYVRKSTHQVSERSHAKSVQFGEDDSSEELLPPVKKLAEKSKKEAKSFIGKKSSRVVHVYTVDALTGSTIVHGQMHAVASMWQGRVQKSVAPKLAVSGTPAGPDASGTDRLSWDHLIELKSAASTGKLKDPPRAEMNCKSDICSAQTPEGQS